MDYGFQPLFLVAADLTPAQDSAVTANTDVFAFPANLATAVGGGGVTAAQNALEAALIPAQWVNGSMLWSQVARIIAGMFQFMQRLNGILGNAVVIDASAKLNAQWQTVPVDDQSAVLEAAQSLGYNTSFIQPTTQLRAILKTFADAWGNTPFRLGNFVF